MLSSSFFVESRIYVPIFWFDCRFCMKANMAAGTTPAISHCDLALLNEAASKILLERGRGYHQEVVHHATNRGTFQYSIQNGKKVAVTIQVFVGTKTGWFRGFCSYYVKRGEGEGETCSGNNRGKGMRWHTRIFFCDSFVYSIYPSTFEKIVDSKRLVVCMCFNSEGHKVTIATVVIMGATRSYKPCTFQNGVKLFCSKLKHF